MGTSTSFRSPLRPRWQAFAAALGAGEPTDRIRSEIFNAGDEWQQELASDAVGSFAQTLVEVFESLSVRLTESERPDQLLATVIAEARDASTTVGFSPALSLAERAFSKVVMEALVSREDLTTSGEVLAAQWESGRGASQVELLGRFTGEILSQYCRHVVEREAGRLVQLKSVDRPNLSGVIEKLTAQAAEIGVEAAASRVLEPNTIGEVWRDVVGAAFESGRGLDPSAA